MNTLCSGSLFSTLCINSAFPTETCKDGVVYTLGPFNYYVTLFLANFDPPPPCHKVSHWSEPPPRNVTLVCRPGLKPVMLKKEYIITSKILTIY